MLEAKWRKDCRLFQHADAEKCAKELREINEDLEQIPPEAIVEKAKDESTELHKCFTWDNDEAARKYRLIEARNVVRLIVIREAIIPEDRPEIRMFYKTKSGEGYKPIDIIVRKEDEYKALLERAWKELRAFKAKYAILNELQEIFSLID